ncbi:MAG: hypothetical protein ABJP66_20470 [Hyphomicrobiales bacterium]
MADRIVIDYRTKDASQLLLGTRGNTCALRPQACVNNVANLPPALGSTCWSARTSKSAWTAKAHGATIGRLSPGSPINSRREFPYVKTFEAGIKNAGGD